MSKGTLLSDELAKVKQHIEDTRIEINKKYVESGHPDGNPQSTLIPSIAPPLFSPQMADAVKKIFVLNTWDATATANDIIKGKVAYVKEQRIVGNMPECSGTIELKHDKKQDKLPPGYYPEGILGKIIDWYLVYVYNRQGLPAKIQNILLGDSFTIPDFNITESKDAEEFVGWHHNPDATSAEYNTGDNVANFPYEPKITVDNNIAFLYAVWEIALKNITLEFEYVHNNAEKNAGIIQTDKTEKCTMTVRGNGEKYKDIIDMVPDIKINPFKEEIKTKWGEDYYQCEYTFDKPGVYPVVVTHTYKGKSKVAEGEIRIVNKNGSMGDEGTMHKYTNSSWFDSYWVAPTYIKGCFISKVKLFASIPGHSGGTDAICIFGRDSKGKEYLLCEWKNTTKREVDLTSLDDNNIDVGREDITFGSVTLERHDLGNSSHYIPSKNDYLTYGKDDDIRQVRFFVFSSHPRDCMNGSRITYDLDYEFDHDLYSQDEKNPPPDPRAKNPNTPPTPDPTPEPSPNPDPTNPDPIPTPTPTVSINNVDEWSNFNTESIEEILGSKWGYYLLTTKGFTGQIKEKLLILYRRFYNIAKDNGNYSEYKYTDYNTKQEISFMSTYTEYGQTFLVCYFDDLKIPTKIVNLIYQYVFMDNEELLLKWINQIRFLGPNSTTSIAFCFERYIQRDMYLSTCESTFNEIKNIIERIYPDIKYVDASFNTKYAKYTPDQKKRIAKVIHDYIILNSRYAPHPENDTENLNQCMYPALSNYAKDPVCASYGHAFCWCCRKWGILSNVVLGLGDPREPSSWHLWSFVNYESGNIPNGTSPWALSASKQASKWQEVDLTWDDPGFVQNNYISWKFHNKTTTYFYNQNHRRKTTNLNGTVNGNSIYTSYPVSSGTCTTNVYNYDDTNEGGQPYIW